VHCSSDEVARSWTPEGWRALAKHAWYTHGLPVVEVGMSSVLGPGDAEGYVDLTGRCTILETAEVIRRSALFVGIDSGPAHLANAVGVPGLILLGRYRKWGEYTPYTGLYADPSHATLLRHEGPPSDLPVARCLAALDEMVEKTIDRSRSDAPGRSACRPDPSPAATGGPEA
jgi:heptosyltransferase-3